MSRPPDIVVPLLSRRRERALLVQKAPHVFGGAVLLLHGMTALRADAHGPTLALAALEVLVSLLLLVAAAQEVRRQRSGLDDEDHAHGVDWIDVGIAGVLGAEVLERWHTDGHLVRPTIVMAVFLLATGLLHPWIAAFGGRRRALRVTAEGVSIPRRPFGRDSGRWHELASITPVGPTARVVWRDGRSRSIDLRDTRHDADIVVALEEARRRLETFHADRASAGATSEPALAPKTAPGR